MHLAEPHDQASGLRRMFTAGAAFRSVGVMGPDARATARATLLLARGLARQGDRVLVLDEASPPHNVGGQLGMVPPRDLSDLPRMGLDAAVRPVGEELALLSARDGIAVLATLDERDLRALTEYMAPLAPEWMLFNAARTGGGLAATADLRILVLPGSRAHLAEAYAVLKTAHAAREQGVWLVLVEGVEADGARRLHAALAQTAEHFLGFEPLYLGCLDGARRGAAEDAGQDLAETLAGMPLQDTSDFAQAWQRMWLFSRMHTARAYGTPDPASAFVLSGNKDNKVKREQRRHPHP
ncbi:MAG: hypothetical protein HZB71_07125 [Betaproteobacteria bacterium]|nr:hypothetical protein [Betaproteobacteria bacterium]